jgi:PAS domain S-box-containing protein
MITRLKSWLSPPVFPADEEKTRVAGVLHTLLLAILAGLGTFIVFIWILPDISALRLIVIGPLFTVALALLLLMRRGYVRLASVVLSISLWAAATALCVIAGGVRAPVFSGYLIVVLSAGVLLGWRSALGFAGLSLVTSLALLYATNADLLPTPFYGHTNTSIGITQLIFLFWGTVVLSLARRSVDDALRRMHQELAERRRAETALRESEARYRTLVSNFPNGAVLLFDNDLRYTLAEGAGLAEAGLSKSALEGKTIWEVFEPDICRSIEPPFRAALDGTPMITEVPFLDRIYRMHTLPVPDALGTIVVGMVMTQDITADKRAEAALKESEERYARLADAAFEGLGFSENGIIIDANARLADILCYRREELIGLTVEQIVAPESRDLVQRRSQTSYQGMYEHLALRKDGTIVPVEVRSRQAQYHGRPIRVTAIRDISERLAAEQALAASELRFRVAFHANPAPQLLTRAPDGFIIDVNPAYERLVGYARDDLLGKSTKDHAVWVEWDREQLVHILQAQGRIVDRATQVRTRSGAVCDVILSIEPVQIGETACYLGVMIDITERKQAEEDLRTYTRRLEYLQDIDQIILSSRSVAEIADAAMRRLCALIVCSRAEVLFIDGETNEVAIVAQVTDRPTSIQVGYRYSLAERPPRAALLAGQIVIEQDISDETLASPSLQRLRDEGMRARMIVPLLVQGQFIGAIHLTADQPYALTDEQRRVARELADHLAIGLQSARLFAEVQATNARLQTLSRQLVTAQEDERRHIARELHDEIGQALALVKLNIRAVQRTAGSSDLAPRLEQSLGVIEDTLLRVRALALDLRPSVLDDLGLVAALQWYLDQQAHLAGLAAEVIVATHVDRLPTEIETVCFRVVQEALSNVVRHAQARSFRVTVEQRDNTAGLVISDDGVGFDAGRALARAVQGQSGGLLGMQERVMLCGGRLTIESSAQRGTTIRAWIPLPLESPIAAGEKEQSA